MDEIDKLILKALAKGENKEWATRSGKYNLPGGTLIEPGTKEYQDYEMWKLLVGGDDWERGAKMRNRKKKQLRPEQVAELEFLEEMSLTPIEQRIARQRRLMAQKQMLTDGGVTPDGAFFLSQLAGM